MLPIRLAILAGLAGSLLAQLRTPGLDQLSHQQFQQLFSKSFAANSGAVAGLGAARHVCSIPLEEAKVEHPERYSMRRMPVGPPPGRQTLVDPGIVGPTPAPACKNWPTGR